MYVPYFALWPGESALWSPARHSGFPLRLSRRWFLSVFQTYIKLGSVSVHVTEYSPQVCFQKCCFTSSIAGNRKHCCILKNWVFLMTATPIKLRKRRTREGLAPEKTIAADNRMLHTGFLFMVGWLSHEVTCPLAHVSVAFRNVPLLNSSTFVGAKHIEQCLKSSRSFVSVTMYFLSEALPSGVATSSCTVLKNN